MAVPRRGAFDAGKFETFLALLPRTTRDAAHFARGHDHRLRAPAHLDVDADRPLRHAVEIRHESFCTPAFLEMLRRHNVALVCADTVDWPLLMDVTADFVYCRLHGNRELYNSRYSEAELDQWADRIRRWTGGKPMRDGHFVSPPVDDGIKRDCFVFFDNTDKLQAPDNARGLMQRLAIAPPAASASIAA